MKKMPSYERVKCMAKVASFVRRMRKTAVLVEEPKFMVDKDPRYYEKNPFPVKFVKRKWDYGSPGFNNYTIGKFGRGRLGVQRWNEYKIPGGEGDAHPRYMYTINSEKDIPTLISLSQYYGKNADPIYFSDKYGNHPGYIDFRDASNPVFEYNIPLEESENMQEAAMRQYLDQFEALATEDLHRRIGAGPNDYDIVRYNRGSKPGYETVSAIMNSRAFQTPEARAYRANLIRDLPGHIEHYRDYIDRTYLDGTEPDIPNVANPEQWRQKRQPITMPRVSGIGKTYDTLSNIPKKKPVVSSPKVPKPGLSDPNSIMSKYLPAQSKIK